MFTVQAPSGTHSAQPYQINPQLLPPSSISPAPSSLSPRPPPPPSSPRRLSHAPSAGAGSLPPSVGAGSPLLRAVRRRRRPPDRAAAAADSKKRRWEDGGAVDGGGGVTGELRAAESAAAWPASSRRPDRERRGSRAPGSQIGGGVAGELWAASPLSSRRQIEKAEAVARDELGVAQAAEGRPAVLGGGMHPRLPPPLSHAVAARRGRRRRAPRLAVNRAARAARFVDLLPICV